MRRDTKIAIGVAVVVIGAGTIYLFSGPGSGDQPTAKSISDGDRAKTDAGTPVAANKPTGYKPSLINKPPPTTPTASTNDNSRSSGSSTVTPPRPRPAEGGLAEGTTPGGIRTPSVTPVRPTNIGTGSSASAGMTGPVTPAAGDATGVGVRTPLAASTATRPAVALPSPTVSSTTPPAGTTTKPASDVAGSETTHVIKSGDTFSGLAAKYLGSTKYANKIAAANPDMDPRRLQLGAKVKIPAVPQAGAGQAAVASPAPAGKPAATPSVTSKPPVASGKPAPAVRSTPGPVPSDRSYTVKAGDQWYTLAQKFLNDGNRWTELFELNKGRVPLNFHNLPVGTVIEIPADAKQSASAR